MYRESEALTSPPFFFSIAYTLPFFFVVFFRWRDYCCVTCTYA